MKKHENICVFYKKQSVYNPQFDKGTPYIDKGNRANKRSTQTSMKKTPIINDGYRYPSSVKKFSNGNNGAVHPTQKPVALFEYLIKTYTNKCDIVLDNCMGSGTTAVAALNTNRKFIGFETEPAYIEIANKRIDALTQ
jgi:site-specific DNA-methyltransferase (adenine-specific)